MKKRKIFTEYFKRLGDTVLLLLLSAIVMLIGTGHLGCSHRNEIIHPIENLEKINAIKYQIQKLDKELSKERDKVLCKECKGTGGIIENFGIGMSSSSSCTKCNGEGRHS